MQLIGCEYSDNTATMPKPENIKPHEYKKGESGNPDGRPKGAKNRATILRKWIDTQKKFKHPGTGEQVEGTLEDEIYLALLAKGLDKDVAAIKEINDTLYGKIKEQTELTGIPQSINITVDSSETAETLKKLRDGSETH